MAAFAAVSFAEGITFGAWLRALAAPVANDGDETITAAGNSWGYGARTARINVSATAPDGNAGFNMGVYNDVSMSLSAGDEANLWVKPLDIVKVSYGKYDNNNLRGDLCYGSWNWLRPTSSWIAGDEGLLMSGNGDTGLMAEITPVEGLYIQALVPITTTAEKAADTYKKLRGGFAYTVPGLLRIKGQYIGMGKGSEDVAAVEEVQGTYIDAAGAVQTTTSTDYKLQENETWLRAPVAAAAAKTEDGNSNCNLEAEVDVLAVEGLFAGVGFQYNVIKDADKSESIDNQMKIALGVSYQVMPELKVSASGAFFTYYKSADTKVDPRFQAGLGVDYDLGDGLAVNADFRYVSPFKVDGEKSDNTDHIAFSVGVQKSVSSNGYIGVAFQGQTNSGNFANNVITGKANDDGEMKNFTWCVPVALSVWF